MEIRRPAGELRLVHSSDLHVDDCRHAATDDDTGASALAQVLVTARGLGADILLLAGDTFETNELSPSLIEEAGMLLANAGMPVVILPGNHDPALANSVYVKGGYVQIANLAILGISHDEVAAFAPFDLEIWGRPHRD